MSPITPLLLAAVLVSGRNLENKLSYAPDKWNKDDWTPEKGQHWIKAASLLLPKDCQWKPNVKHTLSVKVAKNEKGRKEMVCTCNGYTLQYVDDALPDEFYGGILGCEGRNFFWDFSATTK